MDRFARTIKTLLIVLVLLVGVGAVFSAYAHTAHAQGVSAMVNPQNTLANPVGDEGEGIASMILGWVLRPFAWAFQLVGTLFMTFGSSFLGRAIEISIGDTSPIRTVAGIQVGWQVMRDFSNLFFIFVILYIAIQTILQMGNHDTKKMLVRVIAVALLINFSGLFTRIIIDAGNVLAVGLYNRIVTSNAPNNAASTCGAGNCTIGDRFASILEVNEFAQGGGNVSGALQISIMYFLNGAIFLVLGLVFLKGAFYFIARVLAFIFLIIFSPFAFLAYAVPNSKASSFLSAWWSKLIGYSMLAPAYMMIMYLVLQVSTGIASGGGGFDFMNYVIIVGLIKIGSDQAFKLADAAGTGIAKWGTNTATGLAIGGGAFVARQTLGTASRAVASSESLRMTAEKKGFVGGMARIAMRGADKGQQSSFDVRGTKLGQMGLTQMTVDAGKAGGKGGREAEGGVMATVSRLPVIGGVATLMNAGRIGDIGTDKRKALAKEAEGMKKRGFSPEEIEKYVTDRAGATRTKKIRRLSGYKKDKGGNDDPNQPIYEIVGGARVSGYQHEAFKETRTEVDLGIVEREQKQRTADATRIKTMREEHPDHNVYADEAARLDKIIKEHPDRNSPKFTKEYEELVSKQREALENAQQWDAGTVVSDEYKNLISLEQSNIQRANLAAESVKNLGAQLKELKKKKKESEDQEFAKKLKKMVDKEEHGDDKKKHDKEEKDEEEHEDHDDHGGGHDSGGGDHH